METAIDPHDGLAAVREVTRLVFRHPSRARQAGRDLPVFIQVRVVLGRGDDRHELVAALGRLPDRLQRHAGRFGGQSLPVAGEVAVVRELVVGADPVAEERLRRREVLRNAGSDCGKGQNDRDGGQRAAGHGPVGGEKRHFADSPYEDPVQILCGSCADPVRTRCRLRHALWRCGGRKPKPPGRKRHRPPRARRFGLRGGRSSRTPGQLPPEADRQRMGGDGTRIGSPRSGPTPAACTAEKSAGIRSSITALRRSMAPGSTSHPRSSW